MTVLFKEHYQYNDYEEGDKQHYQDINKVNKELEKEINEDPHKFGLIYKASDIYKINKEVAEIKIQEKHAQVVKDNIENNEWLVDEILFKKTQQKVKRIKETRPRCHSFDENTMLKRENFYEQEQIKEQVEDEFFNDKMHINYYFETLFEIISCKIEKQQLDLLPYYDKNKADAAGIDYSAETKKLNKLLDDLEKEKELVAAYYKDEEIPSFHTVDALGLGRSEMALFNEIWKDFEKQMEVRKAKIIFKMKIVNIDIQLILHKVFNPPVIGCIIGLFIGISGMRDILFSSNHYLHNLYYVITMSSKAFVPLLFMNVGNSLMNAPKFNLNFSLTKQHLIFAFINAFIIVPFVGMGIIEIWKAIYGGIIKESKAFRFAIFISYCLPASPNFIIILSILDNFYMDEYSYILNKQTLSLIITVTIILLLYFLIIG